MKISKRIHVLFFLFLAACAPNASTPAAPVAISTTAPTLAPTARPTEKTNPLPQPTAIPNLIWNSEGIRLKPSDFGVAVGDPLADVSVATLSDGSFRLYAFAQRKGIVSAISRDGLQFTPESGARLPDGYGMPRVIAVEKNWRLFFITQGGIGSALSSDGLNFTIEPGLRVKGSDHNQKELSGPSIVRAPNGGYRIYYSDLPKPGAGPAAHTLFSATTSDLLNWTPDPNFKFGAQDANDRNNSAEHPFALRATDGTYWMFFHRLEELWTAKSKDGITWTDAASTGLRGNDPDVVTLADGSWRMYYGNFDPATGGFVLSARQIPAPWSIAIKSAPGGAQGFGFAVSVTGASEKIINLRVTQNNKPVPGVTLSPSSGKPPFQVSFTIPGQLFGPAPIVLEADDGSLTRQFTLTPPPPQ
ncbi:MAG: hypothetical protein HY257_07605 [Chloroflexi bacterium]|nr:hypothetical protein [Chloroflexota bacterium]